MAKNSTRRPARSAGAGGDFTKKFAEEVGEVVAEMGTDVKALTETAEGIKTDVADLAKKVEMLEARPTLDPQALKTRLLGIYRAAKK